MKKIYIGTNTKMYMDIRQTKDYLQRLWTLTKDLDRKRLEVFVIPSFTTLDAARKHVPVDMIRIGAQNMCWKDEGQFTGEISPLMLKEVGVEIIEIGHSERRHVLGETDEMENAKVRCALAHDFTALLCIGETLSQKQDGISNETLRVQLKRGLAGVSPRKASLLWIAYEPVWAIGVNGVPATKEYAEEKHCIIRETLVELFGCETGESIPLLYGGSVNNENAVGLINRENVDGLFIGRSAWDADNFNKIIRSVLASYEFGYAQDKSVKGDSLS